MNPYSDIPFYIQELIERDFDIGIVLLITMAPETPTYKPKEYLDFFGCKINKDNCKPIDWQRIVESDLPRPKRTYLPWEKLPGKITSYDPLPYKVTREKLPIYEMGQIGVLSKYRISTVRDEYQGQSPSKVEQLSIEPVSIPSFKISDLDNDIETVDWVNPQIDAPSAGPKTTQYEIQNIYQMGSVVPISIRLSPIKTIDITFNIEKEDE
jgi:hypothetical protein